MTVRSLPLALAAALALPLAIAPLALGAELEPLTPGRGIAPAIQDDRLYQDGVDVEGRLAEMAAIGARFVRVDMRWDLIATRQPADPRNPDDPAYDWSAYDRILDAARENSIRVIFTVWGTPGWAADPRVPASPSFGPHTTRPRSAADFGKFGAAAVARYRPRGVLHWEAWNEPNIPLFLRPQYVERRGKLVPFSPAIYANMLKSFYREAKDVAPSVRICGGVTAPAGEPVPRTTDSRIAPIAFYTQLAKRRPKLDAVCHHPYPITKPRTSNFPGASYVDLYNLDTLVKALDRTSLRGKQLWLTEFGFSTESVPQYKLFFSQTEQARFLVDAFRRVRPGNRVGIFTWYLWQDNAEWKSGLLNEDGSPKRSYEAFALPATTSRSGVREGNATLLLGQIRSAKGKTRVIVQRRLPGRWINVGRPLDTGADGSFRARLRPEKTARYRVVWRGETRVGTVARRASPSFRIRVT